MKNIERLIEIAEKTNIATDLDADRLGKISALCLAGYKEDLETNTEVFEKLDKYEEIAQQVLEEKTEPFPGAANAKYPIITTSAMQFNARAYPQLAPASGVAKAKHYGDDDNDIKKDRAQRVSRHISFQVAEKIPNWAEEFDSLLLKMPIVSACYKKTYYDPIKRRPRSDVLPVKALVVNNDTTKSLEDCDRITEVFERKPQRILQNIEAGLWRDIREDDESFLDLDSMEPIELLEQHILLDIYESNEVEPYIVTMTTEGDILRIKAGFDESTIFVERGDEVLSIADIRDDISTRNDTIRERNMALLQVAAEAGRVDEFVAIPEMPEPIFRNEKPVYVEKIEYYTEYYCFPSFSGKFAKDGIASLVFPMTDLINSTLNRMLDAGTFSNLRGGFKQMVGKGPSGPMKIKPGEYPSIDTGGRPIGDVIKDFNFPGPSATLFNLLGFLVEQAENISSVKDIMVGEAPQGETATTTMIKQEEGRRVFTAIYKRVYKSLSKELQKIYRLNRKYLTDKEYFRFGDSEEYVAKKDYEDSSLDIAPTADPEDSTLQQKVLKAQALMQMMEDPDADQREIKRNYFEAMGIDFDRFFPEPQGSPPPNPEQMKTVAEIKQIETEIEQIKVEMALTKTKILETIAKAEKTEVGSQIELYKTIAEGLMGDVSRTDQTGKEGVEAQPGDAVDEEPIAPGMETGEPGEIV